MVCMKFDEIIVTGKPGERHLLLGNEAIARGALEAGVAVCTGYPGTPASEVLDLMVSSRERTGVYAEYSMNEIVGLEVAGGASYSGLRSMAVMKHVGLNVAADAFFTLAYTGAPGGLVACPLTTLAPSARKTSRTTDTTPSMHRFLCSSRRRLKRPRICWSWGWRSPEGMRFLYS